MRTDNFSSKVSQMPTHSLFTTVSWLAEKYQSAKSMNYGYEFWSDKRALWWSDINCGDHKFYRSKKWGDAPLPFDRNPWVGNGWRQHLRLIWPAGKLNLNTKWLAQTRSNHRITPPLAGFAGATTDEVYIHRSPFRRQNIPGVVHSKMATGGL